MGKKRIQINYGGPMVFQQNDNVPHYAYPEFPRDTQAKALPDELQPPLVPEPIGVTLENGVLTLFLPMLRDRALTYTVQKASTEHGPWENLKKGCGGQNVLTYQVTGPMNPTFYRLLAVGSYGQTPSPATSFEGIVYGQSSISSAALIGRVIVGSGWTRSSSLSSLAEIEEEIYPPFPYPESSHSSSG